MMKFSLLIENIFCLLKKHISRSAGNWPAVGNGNSLRRMQSHRRWERLGALIKMSKKIGTCTIDAHNTYKSTRHCKSADPLVSQSRRCIRCQFYKTPFLVAASSAAAPRAPAHTRNNTKHGAFHISPRRIFFLPQNRMINPHTHGPYHYAGLISIHDSALAIGKTPSAGTLIE